jgi:hypothetical protein
LLAFDGRIHHLERGYWLKFEVKRTKPVPERQHGLRYSLTLHGPDGNRLMGFDNAFPGRGRRTTIGTNSQGRRTALSVHHRLPIADRL